MTSRELVKVVCQAVVLERDGQGRILGEIESGPVACYTVEQLASFHAQAALEVQEFNAAQPNRAQRRSRKKEGTP